MQTTKIEFRKERDFTGVLSASLTFLKFNFKPLFGAILAIIGPVILLTGVAYSFLQTHMMSAAFSMRSGMFNTSYFTYMGTVYLLLLVNSVLLNSVVFNYMCLYNEKPAGERITVSEVGARVWKSLGRVLLSLLILVVSVVALGLVLVLIGMGFGSMGVFGAILIVLAAIVLLLIYAPVWTYYISAGFFVVVRDRVLILSGFGKVRRYMPGNFWWTWLILVVVTISLSIVQIVFNLPASILSMTETFSRVRQMTSGGGAGDTSVLLIICYTVGRFLTTCSFAILHLVCAFHFLSNEEKEEGKGMMGLIDEIK